MTEGSPRDRELRRYETILDSLDDAVYAVRPDGTIAYVNDRYAEMKGVSREALLGTDIYDWVTEETAEKATQVQQRDGRGRSRRRHGRVRVPHGRRGAIPSGDALQQGDRRGRRGAEPRRRHPRRPRAEAARGGAPPQERTARGVREHRLARPPDPSTSRRGGWTSPARSTTPSTWRSSPTPTSEWRRSSTTS